MADPQTDAPSTPPPSADPILGETAGIVVVFHRVHGFIRTVHFGSVFVHASSLLGGHERLEPGQQVSARVREGPKGRYAEQVAVVGACPEGPAATPGAPPPARQPQQVATAIARRLGEQDTAPRAQIRRLVKHVGPEQAWALLGEAEQIEAQGGMLLPDGSRRRTPGGGFFALAKARLDPDGLAHVFPPKPWQLRHERARDKGAEPPPPPAPPPPLRWADRGELIGAARAGQGRATTVKVTVIGRPESVAERGSTVILMLTHRGPLPALPKGVPSPAEVPATTYVVYVAAKQWRGVAEAIQNPEDSLIIEGTQVWDAEYQAITVYTTRITTKLQQRGKRQGPDGPQPTQQEGQERRP
jgi:cold shock CspA family protein